MAIGSAEAEAEDVEGEGETVCCAAASSALRPCGGRVLAVPSLRGNAMAAFWHERTLPAARAAARQRQDTLLPSRLAGGWAVPPRWTKRKRTDRWLSVLIIVTAVHTIL